MPLPQLLALRFEGIDQVEAIVMGPMNEDETDGDSHSGDEKRMTPQGREWLRTKYHRMLFIAK
jgi:hypothetical protein